MAKTNLTLNGGFEWPGCDAKSNSLILSGQAHASHAGSDKGTVRTYGMAQQSSAVPQRPLPSSLPVKIERALPQKMTCPQGSHGRGRALPAGRWVLG